MIAMEVSGSSCVEYAFLKLDPEFVNAASRTKGVDMLRLLVNSGQGQGGRNGGANLLSTSSC